MDAQLSLDFTTVTDRRFRYERPPKPYPVEMRDGEPAVVVPIADHGRLGEMLVSEQDRELAERRCWRVGTNGYACSTIGGRHVEFHRLIMSPPKGLEVDHLNGQLDNRRSRLRNCTKSENGANRNRPRTNKYGQPVRAPYRGVKQDGARFLALITIKGKQYCPGSYRTAELAALAFDREARRQYGAFARLNFPHIQSEDITVNRTITFALERETKGAVRYAELGRDGNVVDQGESTVGSLYIRKSAIEGAIPTRVTITIDTEAAA